MMTLEQTAGVPGFLISLPSGFTANQGFCCISCGQWSIRYKLGSRQKVTPRPKVRGSGGLLLAGREGRLRMPQEQGQLSLDPTSHSNARLVHRQREAGPWIPRLPGPSPSTLPCVCGTSLLGTPPREKDAWKTCPALFRTARFPRKSVEGPDGGKMRSQAYDARPKDHVTPLSQSGPKTEMLLKRNYQILGKKVLKQQEKCGPHV